MTNSLFHFQKKKFILLTLNDLSTIQIEMILVHIQYLQELNCFALPHQVHKFNASFIEGKYANDCTQTTQICNDIPLEIY